MKIKFNILFVLSLLSFNINADISQSRISNLQQLDNQDIVGLISGNKFDTTIFSRLLADSIKNLVKSMTYKCVVTEWE